MFYHGKKSVKRLFAPTVATAVCASVCSGCDGVSFGGLFERVTVELVNTTDYPVDPQLYADDDEHTLFEFNIRTDENFVNVGLVPANSTVVVTLSCDEAGTLQMYEALQIRSLFELESDNDPIVYEDGDFDCQDTVSFIFRESLGGFYTRVEVNGRVISD